jgi:nicotianamine synthase-like protein
MLKQRSKTKSDCGPAVGMAGRAVALCIDAVNEQSYAGREQVFTELDHILARLEPAKITSVLGDPAYIAMRENVHSVRADYEYQREYVLAKEIIGAHNRAPARAFRSAEWYSQATHFEMQALIPYQPRRMLFVGSGPFPISPLSYMAEDPAVEVTCLERSPDASEHAVEVAKVFGFDQLKVITADAFDVADYDDFDCVMVGLVVGTSDSDKNRIVDHFLRRVPNSTLLTFRTAVGSGRVIYPSIEPGRFGDAPYTELPDPPHESFTMVLLDRSGA